MINNEVTKVFQLVIFLFLVTFIAIGCGSSGGGGDDDDDDDQSLTITGESGNPVNLNGSWDSGCDADLDDGESERAILTISGSTFSQDTDLWLDSITCPGASDVSVTMSGTIVLGDELTVSMNGPNVTATAFDVTVSSFEGTINNPDVVADFNADELCGFDDWVFDTPKDLLGTTCAPDLDDKDVLYIDDTANPDVLYDGDEEGILDANGYPTDIDLDSEKERI